MCAAVDLWLCSNQFQRKSCNSTKQLSLLQSVAICASKADLLTRIIKTSGEKSTEDHGKRWKIKAQMLNNLPKASEHFPCQRNKNNISAQLSSCFPVAQLAQLKPSAYISPTQTAGIPED
ncbi:hypothetical protein Anapl_05185 [Anas platyrhynchos]|uniref:Uncharacterized protein n=1 Tax=Anas platyrhynchos TaxID=8839 RepID=R0LQ33_ANAPL|nr:hypothetical protein Anapl_05185 [Anas platyrhynchos]